eukprot:7387051-Pyramimonas_sp.AAC.1
MGRGASSSLRDRRACRDKQDNYLIFWYSVRDAKPEYLIAPMENRSASAEIKINIATYNVESVREAELSVKKNNY